MFTSTFAMSAEPLKIFGGPGAIKLLNQQKTEIEKATGRPLETREQAGDTAFIALAKGHIDAVASSPGLEGLMEIDTVKKANVGGADKFEEKIYGNTIIFVVLSPNNPATALSREQIADLLSGKLKTWESITGKKDPVKVILNKTQSSTIRMVPKFYLNKAEIPDVTYVTTIQGAIKNLQQNPGAITFSGSKFEESDFKPKFFETEVKFPYVFIARKPLSPEMSKIFSLLKTP